MAGPFPSTSNVWTAKPSTLRKRPPVQTPAAFSLASPDHFCSGIRFFFMKASIMPYTWRWPAREEMPCLAPG